MKKAFKYLILFLLFPTILLSQKHDNIWTLGGYYFGSNYYYNLDFSSGNPDTVVYQRKMNFFITDASISDSSGNLQFYTNGIWVANRDHDTLFNSSNFNTGWGTQIYQFGGMGLSQSVIILPFNVTSQFYYLIYENADTITIQGSTSDTQPLSLRYSIIDMNLDSSRGGVVSNSKNIIIINDTLLLGRITACKHANGRDWWVIVHKYYSDIYYKVLYTSTGIIGPFQQQIGTTLSPKLQNGVDTDVGGMAVFSPDGTKYVQVGPSNDIHIMDFDRCSGWFSNYRMIDLPDTSWSLGCSFSPNSQFLYTNTYLNTYQFDTQAPNIEASKITVAVYDGHIGWSGQSWFFINQIGPDGKIYMSTFNSNRQLHVINFPDSSGMNCDLTQHSYELPQNYQGNRGLPNNPNYRLGPVIGSICDTLLLNINTKVEVVNFSIFPNPNRGSFRFSYQLPQNQDGLFEIYDLTGRKVFEITLPTWSSSQIVNLPQCIYSGVYNCRITSDNKHLNKKIIVIRE